MAKKKTKAKKTPQPKFKHGPVSLKKGVYYVRYRNKKGEKLKRVNFKTKADAELFKKFLKKDRGARFAPFDIKLNKKVKRAPIEVRAVLEPLYAPSLGQFLDIKGDAYRYRVILIDGTVIKTRSKNEFLSVVNDEVQKQRQIVEMARDKYGLKGTYGRINPDTERRETKDGRMTSFYVDFTKYPNLDLFRKYYNEFKNDFVI